MKPDGCLFWRRFTIGDATSSVTSLNPMRPTHANCNHGGIHRRTFLADLGMGFTGIALGAMLQQDGIARAASAPVWTPPDGTPNHRPRAKSVIWLFMNGGVSHMESFDPKPELDKYAGKSIGETRTRMCKARTN